MRGFRKKIPVTSNNLKKRSSVAERHRISLFFVTLAWIIGVSLLRTAGQDHSRFGLNPLNYLTTQKAYAATSTCGVNADPYGSVVGWNKENSAYNGAGTQYAAFAMNYIQDFASAQGTAGQAPTGLSFSNTNNVDTSGGGEDTYGGNFGSVTCTPDYWCPPASAVKTGDIPIPGVSVPNGVEDAIYVDGNAEITGNIKYSNSYANLGDIPSFKLIVKGNIYIDSSVSEIDGLLVAEPDASGNNGVIYTCASGFAAPALKRSLYNNCNNQLTVNGSMIAKQVWMTRTSGTLYGNTPAEVVNYTPDTWISNFPACSDETTGEYNAVTQLPPSL